MLITSRILWVTREDGRGGRAAGGEREREKINEEQEERLASERTEERRTGTLTKSMPLVAAAPGVSMTVCFF